MQVAAIVLVNLLLTAIIVVGVVLGVIVLSHLYNVIVGNDSIDWALLGIIAGYGIVVNGLIGSALWRCGTHWTSGPGPSDHYGEAKLTPLTIGRISALFLASLKRDYASRAKLRA